MVVTDDGDVVVVVVDVRVERVRPLQPLQPVLAPPHERLVAASQRVQSREHRARSGVRVDGRVGRAARRKHDVGQHDARAAVRAAGPHRRVGVHEPRAQGRAHRGAGRVRAAHTGAREREREKENERETSAGV